jgi:spore coat protein U-like protein
MNEESSGERVRRRTDMSRAYSNVPIGLAAIAGLLIAAAPAGAQVQNEKLEVQARIGELCTVTSASLDFGQLGDLDQEDVFFDAEGEIEIDCGGVTTPIDIALDGGLQPTGQSRQMAGSGTPIIYFLFKDSARQQVWTPGELVGESIEGTGSVPVYGRVPSQPDGHTPGLYTDEVTITLSF